MATKTIKIGDTVLVKNTAIKGIVCDIKYGSYKVSGQYYKASNLIAEKTKAKLKAKSKINKFSELTTKLLNIYRAYSRQWLQHNKVCLAKYEGCTGQATEIHHMAGRQGYWLLMSKYFLPICRRCHRRATPKSREAIECGVSVSRNRNLEIEFNKLEKELILKAGLPVPENKVHI